MDEVDGMSAGDRGGVADLIQVRKGVGSGGWGVCVWGRWGGGGGCWGGLAGTATATRCRAPAPHRAAAAAPSPAAPHATPSPATQTIHKTKVPIICICNDKYNMKLKALRNHTLELDYRK